MKRLLLLVLTLACVLACLALGVTAEETNPGTTEPGTTEPGTTEPGTTEPGTSQESAPVTSVKTLTLKFFDTVATAFWRLRDYYGKAVSHFGSFARFMPVVLSAVLLIFCFFGYRLFRVETVLVGAVTGYALAYATYDFLLAWQGQIGRAHV